MLRIAVILHLLCWPFCALALVPPEYQEPTERFVAEIEAGFQLNTGNTETSNFNGRTKLVYDTTHTTQEATLKTYFASKKNQTSAEKYDLQLQSNYKLAQSKEYLFARGDFTWDAFGSYTKIATLSSGYGLDLVKNNRAKVIVELGPGYRYNLPATSPTSPISNVETDLILRSATKFSYKLQEYSSINADLTTEIAKNNNTLMLDVNYKNLVFQDWAFKINVNVKYTAEVPTDRATTDTLTTFNLLYTFM